MVQLLQCAGHSARTMSKSHCRWDASWQEASSGKIPSHKGGMVVVVVVVVAGGGAGGARVVGTAACVGGGGAGSQGPKWYVYS